MQKELLIITNKSDARKNALFTVFACVVIVLAFLRIVFNVAYLKVYVIGYSMESTLTGVPDEKYSGGDYVYAFRSQNPRRGDIVVVQTKDKTRPIIKRVIALGGDSVELKEGVLYLNGEAKEEPYVLAANNTPSENNYPETRVPEGCMFCLGDNRNVSVDSRSEKYGCIQLKNIMGIVADWSLSFKGTLTDINTFFDYTLPEAFGIKK